MSSSSSDGIVTPDDSENSGSGSDNDDDLDVETQNKFYEAEEIVDDGNGDREKLAEAITLLNEVITMVAEAPKGTDFEEPWGLKALELIVEVHGKLGESEQMIQNFERLMEMMKQGELDRKDSESTCSKLLGNLDNQPLAVVKQMYNLAFQACQAQTKNINVKLWYKLKMKYAQLLMARAEYGSLPRIMREMEQWCENEESQGRKCVNEMVQLSAMDIELCSLRKDNDRLKVLYKKSIVLIQSAAADNKVTGIINECGGKMHMHDGDYNEAKKNFYEAFSAYNALGDNKRDKCLKFAGGDDAAQW